MKDYGFIIFIFFLVVFLLLLTGGRIIQYIKDTRRKAKKAADEREQNYRDETGRQQRQYHYSRKTAHLHQSRPHTARQPEKEPIIMDAKTATGETIINLRSERENKKIYEKAEGEYVEFSEE